MTRVWIYQTYWDHDGGAEITKVFDSQEKAEKWYNRMKELSDLHQQYHDDGTVTKYGKGTAGCPQIQSLIKEAGNESYLGNIIEMDVE